MMKNRISFTSGILFWLLIQSLSGQTPQENLDKYWFYRDQFFEKFILDEDPHNLPTGATEDGINIPASVYNPTADGWDYSVKWGDTQAKIANYIMTMVTEYRLKQIQNLNTNDISEKLYRILYAMDRVDFAAEKAFNCGYSWPSCYSYTNINGFFIRDDMTDQIFQWWGDNGKTSWGGNLKAEHGWQENDDLTKREMSEDMVWCLLQGYALIKHLVDDNTFYEDYLCENLKLKEYAKKQTARFIQYMHAHSNNSPWDFCSYGSNCYPGEWDGGLLQVWRIKNACTGETVSRGGSWDDLMMHDGHFVDAGEWITEDDYGNMDYVTADEFIIPGFEPVRPLPYTTNHFNNTGKLIMSSIADNKYAANLERLLWNIRKVADYFNQDYVANPYEVKYFALDHLPMFYLLLHPDYVATSNRLFLFYYSHIEQILNAASEDGIFRTIDPPDGPLWDVGNIIDAPTGIHAFPSLDEYGNLIDRSDLIGQHNGLDYMLLFNLYHLMYDLFFNDAVNITNDYPITYTYSATPTYNWNYDDSSIDIGHENNDAYYTVHSKNMISMNSTVNSNGKLCLRGNEVLLQSGFEVKYGGEFTAETNEMMELDFTPPSGSYKMARGNTTVLSEEALSDEEIAIGEEPIDQVYNNYFQVFPNPVNDVLQIESYQPISKLTLYNSGGVAVNQTNGDGYERMNLEVSGYEPGLYFLSVTTMEGHVQVQKVVIE